ncbi:DedA family protein [Phycisphaerales bacterium AB-hyl4]|uniref:DedA family protein n=1 Tax=Natronomicrosphaera hydrolytica TaxID=3242702 RepID=A0ABV4U3K9_9BACT
MEEWLAELAGVTPYLVIFGILLVSGFGLPIPEDIVLILAGYLSGSGITDPWIMFPGAFITILGSDLIVYTLGRRYGHHVPKLPVLRRFLNDARLVRTERKLHEHGGKFIFMARFLPGLRTAAFFTAGTFKIPAWKFLLYDGSAAAISVPLILGLSYAFSHQIDRVYEWVAEGQLAVAGLVVLIIAVAFGVRWWMRRRRRAHVQARRATGWAIRRRKNANHESN